MSLLPKVFLLALFVGFISLAKPAPQPQPTTYSPALAVSQVSAPDLKTPYFINLDAVEPIYCYTFPPGVTLENFDKATPEQRAKTRLNAGTGTIIAKNRLLTAYHVIEGASACGATINSKVVLFSTIYGSKEKDVAVLGGDFGQTAVSSIACDPFKPGAQYLMLGYANGSDFALDYGEFSGLFIDAVVPATTPDNPSATWTHAHLGVFPGAITPGMSGGPVFDLNGHVVGINNVTGVNYAGLHQLSETDLCLALKPAA